MAVNVNGGALEFDAVINAGQFNAAISAIEKQLTSLTKKAEDEARGIDTLVKKTSLAIASYASVATAKNFIGDIVRVRGEFQQLEVAFKTMLKNKSASDKLLAEATTLAAKTPFTLQEVGQSAKQLLAYGFAADNITKNIEMLGNVASGVGAPLGDIVYLYGTLRTQGRAYTKDIMQFTARGIPIISELAKQFGVTETEVQNLVEAGKVGFPEVERAFKSLTGEGGLFFNLMQEQSKTLTGLVSNLQDAWSRMLNDFGKSNEGIFAGAIKGAISVVDNYQDVLDIIKILIATYGSYKAAIIVTNTVMAISTSLAKGYTIAETLRYRAMLISERAMKILNATMLSNPAVAVATGIGLLVSAFVFLQKETSSVITSQKLLADAQTNVNEKLSEVQSKIRPYVEALKNANISEKERLDIYEKLRAIDPDIVKGLTAKTLSYQTLAANVNLYLDKLREQYALEANKEALTASIKQEGDLQKRIDLLNAAIAGDQKLLQLEKNIDSQNAREARSRIFANREELKSLQQTLEQQKKVSEGLGQTQIKAEVKTQVAKQRTVAVIEEEIKALKDQQQQISTTRAQFEQFQQKINQLEAEKLRITGDKKQSKEQEKFVNKLADDLKQLQKDIADAEVDARRSGLAKEESEIDRINKKYEDLKKRVLDLKLKDEQKGGLLKRIENARVLQVSNESDKNGFDQYKKTLEEQKVLFTQFEEYKLSIGEAKAKELLNIQEGSFTDYIAFLKNELTKVDTTTLAGQLRFAEINKQIVEAEKQRDTKLIENRIKTFQDLLAATFSFKDKEKEINDRYDKLETSLSNDATIKNKQERFAILKQGREDELKQLEIDAFKQSAIFRKLNEDITLYSRQRIKELIKDLKELLKNTAGLSPVVKKAIEDQIKALQSVLTETADTKKFREIATASAAALSTLGNSLSAVNKEVGETVSQLSDMVQVGLDAADAFNSFSTGDFAAGIGSIVSALTKIIDGFAKGAQSKKDAFQQIADFQNAIVNSETEINLLYRERQREQIRLNKLKLEGINAEKKLLEEQKKANAKAYADLLARIQKESFVSGQTTSKKFSLTSALTGILGTFSGSRTQVNDVLSSLAGKSFADLEKLFTSGQLTDKAKELFQQLQKIKQEGVDIDALLKQNEEEMKQLFTGTTADSITDSIADGFKNGKRSAADFADDFENLMRNAIIESLKMKALEGPLKEFYDQFASFSQSDGILTQQEIEQLRNNFAGIIKNAGDQFDQLQQITNVGFTGSGSAGGNSLTGAIKGITETQANLLAGQFGGLRLTAMDILSVAKSQLEIQNKIQINTALSAERMAVVIERMQYYYETVGVKIK